MEQSSLQFFGRLILVTILVLGAVWILRRFLPALAWAGVLAIATWPVREWLRRKYMSEWSTAILLSFVVGLLIVGPLLFLAIQIAREAVILVQTMRELRETRLATPDWVSQFPL